MLEAQAWVLRELLCRRGQGRQSLRRPSLADEVLPVVQAGFDGGVAIAGDGVGEESVGRFAEGFGDQAEGVVDAPGEGVLRAGRGQHGSGGWVAIEREQGASVEVAGVGFALGAGLFQGAQRGGEVAAFEQRHRGRHLPCQLGPEEHLSMLAFWFRQLTMLQADDQQSGERNEGAWLRNRGRLRLEAQHTGVKEVTEI